VTVSLLRPAKNQSLANAAVQLIRDRDAAGTVVMHGADVQIAG
jgi:hypothetical protein